MEEDSGQPRPIATFGRNATDNTSRGLLLLPALAFIDEISVELVDAADAKQWIWGTGDRGHRHEQRWTFCGG